MTPYAELDEAIFQAIANHAGTFTGIWQCVRDVAEKAPAKTVFGSRSIDRLIDRRLQALRKAGRIAYVKGYWRVVE